MTKPKHKKFDKHLADKIYFQILLPTYIAGTAIYFFPFAFVVMPILAGTWSAIRLRQLLRHG